jgi:hypothetical protein
MADPLHLCNVWEHTSGGPTAELPINQSKCSHCSAAQSSDAGVGNPGSTIGLS